MPLGDRATWRTAMIAVALLAAVSAVRFLLPNIFGARIAFGLYLIPVIVIAFRGKPIISVLTLIAGMTVARLVTPNVPLNWPGLIQYLIGGVLVIIFSQAYIRKQRSLEAAQQGLREREAMFRELADNAPVFIWLAGTDTGCYFFNKQWLDFRGRTVEQEAGRGWVEGLHPEDADGCLKTYLDSFKARQPFRMEYRLRRRDGEYRWLLNQGVPRYSGSGEFAGYIGSCVDVTDSKLAEIDRQRLASAVDSSDDAIYAVDANGIVTHWNRGAENLFGYTAVEMVGRDLTCIVPEHLHDEFQKTSHTVLKGGRITAFETQRKTRGGDILQVSITASPSVDSAGVTTGACVVSRDMTALRESEQRLRLALSASRMGTWTNDIQDGRVRWSPELEALFELQPGSFEETEEAFMRLVHPEDQAAVREQISNAIELRQEYQVEFRAANLNGREKWVEGRGRPFFDTDGRLAKLAGTAMDITERKRLESELKRRTDELLRSNRELEQFAYVSSHDLQEPLRTIGLYTQLMVHRYGEKLGADADEFISYIARNAQRAQEQIADLLTFARVGQGHTTADLPALDALQQALKDLQVPMQLTQGIVTHGELPIVRANAFDLTLVFQNLIGNALKFKGSEPPRVHVSAGREGNEWIFSVRDNGIGIEPRHHDLIFEVFKRLHTRELHEGTGIGLSICRKAIDRHHGRIWVESELGKGSDFRFTLPV